MLAMSAKEEGGGGDCRSGYIPEKPVPRIDGAAGGVGITPTKHMKNTSALFMVSVCV
jgi:hypothetical protein